MADVNGPVHKPVQSKPVRSNPAQSKHQGPTHGRPKPPTKRPYRLGRRAEEMDRTRQRIAESAFELHALVGPAQATISAIADRAGVQRHTVYRHFPEMVSLIEACTEHGMRTTGLPDPEPWQSIADPLARLRTGLAEMYTYYRRNEQLIANIVRDMAVMPALVEGSAAYVRHIGRIHEVLLEPFSAQLSQSGALDQSSGRLPQVVVGLALDFGAWRALTRNQGLSDDDAVELMTRLVACLERR
jgi:AcrR family transcriptional regulator